MRWLVRKLVHLLLLLALIAGGQASALMAAPMMTGNEQAGQQMPVDCKACGKMDMTAGPCDAACIALPAIEAPTVAIAGTTSRHAWSLQADFGPTHLIRPDTSPPRS